MNNTVAISKTAKFVKEIFAEDATGHDWWHLYRVWQLSKHIAAQEEDANTLVVELAALLHDIGDWKFHDDEETGPKAAREWLKEVNVDEGTIKHVEDIIRHISFKGANVKSQLKTLEGYIVHDADKLDAIGAIGIARVFAYGGSDRRPIYEPDRKPRLHNTFEEYKNDKSGSINHFYDKLLLLKDRMFTKTGKQMAVHRHKFMEMYLEEFYSEWGGKL